MVTHSWTDEDETHYREWVNGDNALDGFVWEIHNMSELKDETGTGEVVYYAAEETWPLWAHALFMIGLLFVCAAFWVGLIWLLFFRS